MRNLNLVMCDPSIPLRPLVSQKAQSDLMTCSPPTNNNFQVISISGDEMNFHNSLLNSWAALR